jgi:cytochrome P450
MTDVELARPPSFARSGRSGEWIASRHDDVQAILADGRFGVPEAGPAGPVGTISWLRASVSRFANGAEHQRRRACAVTELRPLRPHQLRRAACRRATTAIRQAAPPGGRLDVMALLARRVPMAAMAGALGIARAQDAADAVIRIAGGYFPGSDAAAERLADTATAQLVVMLAPDDAGPPDPAMLDVAVARIALMVQGCDATAGLIGNALEFLRDAGDQVAGWSTSALLDEVLRSRPVVRASGRVARQPVRVLGRSVRAGDRVICDIEAASTGQAPASLTFGYGVRPCPGRPQALALATGVIEAVRDLCAFLPGQVVAPEPGHPLRIPARLEVVVR